MNTLQSQHWERIRKRAEQAIGKLIRQKWRERLRKSRASLRGKWFRNISARNRAAQKGTGLEPDEVFGGVLSMEDVLGINNANDVLRFTDENARRGPNQDLYTSILVCGQTVGVGEDDIARSIRAAWASVQESARLRKAADALERADAAYRQAHPEDAERIDADAKADNARARELSNRSLGSHRRRLQALTREKA